jgi:hypothetical protein
MPPLRWYGRVVFGMSSNGTDASAATSHFFSPSCFAIVRSPRNRIVPRSWIGRAVSRAGTNPRPVYRKTMSSSWPSGIGLKNPVSALVTASSSFVASS